MEFGDCQQAGSSHHGETSFLVIGTIRILAFCY